MSSGNVTLWVILFIYGCDWEARILSGSLIWNSQQPSWSRDSVESFEKLEDMSQLCKKIYSGVQVRLSNLASFIWYANHPHTCVAVTCLWANQCSVHCNHLSAAPWHKTGDRKHWFVLSTMTQNLCPKAFVNMSVNVFYYSPLLSSNDKVKDILQYLAFNKSCRIFGSIMFSLITYVKSSLFVSIFSNVDSLHKLNLCIQIHTGLNFILF